MHAAIGQSLKRSETPPPVAWGSWPLRDEPLPTRIALAAMAVAAVAVYVVTSSLPLASLAVLFLAASMWRHVVPVEYHLGARGLRQTFFGRTRLIRWSQIRVVELRKAGLLLYPDTYFGPLRAMRGLYVPWRGCREEVLRLVDFYASTVLVHPSFSESPALPSSTAPPADRRTDREQPSRSRAGESSGTDDSTDTEATIVRGPR